ncbi:MAG: hypothetical protein MJ101_04645 [Clostridia bacterium]|nr:hypothetical protein [Clostridia bacterium]
MTDKDERTMMPWEMEEHISEKPNKASEQTDGPAIETVANIKAATKSKLLLAAAILSVVTVAISAIIGSVDIFGILTAVALFIIYCSPADESFNAGGFGFFAGVQKAKWILIWVVMGICAVSSVIMFAASAFVSDVLINTTELDAFYDEFIDYLNSFGFEGYFDEMPPIESLIGIMIVAVGIALIFVAIVLLVLNLTYYRQVKDFASSVNKVAKSGTGAIRCANAVRVWFMVFGILAALSAFSSLSNLAMTSAISAIDFSEVLSGIDGVDFPTVSFMQISTVDSILAIVSAAASAAEYIIFSQLVNKYFVRN